MRARPWVVEPCGASLKLKLLEKNKSPTDATSAWLVPTTFKLLYMVEVEVVKLAMPLIPNVVPGEVVPMPTLPLSRILKSVVEALSTTSKVPPVPVPLPNMVSLEVGVVVPAAVEPMETRG